MNDFQRELDYSNRMTDRWFIQTGLVRRLDIGWQWANAATPFGKLLQTIAGVDAAYSNDCGDAVGIEIKCDRHEAKNIAFEIFSNAPYDIALDKLRLLPTALWDGCLMRSKASVLAYCFCEVSEGHLFAMPLPATRDKFLRRICAGLYPVVEQSKSRQSNRSIVALLPLYDIRREIGADLLHVDILQLLDERQTSLFPEFAQIREMRRRLSAVDTPRYHEINARA